MDFQIEGIPSITPKPKARVWIPKGKSKPKNTIFSLDVKFKCWFSMHFELELKCKI